MNAIRCPSSVRYVGMGVGDQILEPLKSQLLSWLTR
jgi:hypothetical protein